MSSCSNTNTFYGNTVRASRKLLTNVIDTVDPNKSQISIGGCANKVQINGDLHVSGRNCASCLQTNDPNINVNVSGSNPPSTGQVLVALNSQNAEWQPMSGMGDVSGPWSCKFNR
mgnify:FL=1